MKERVILHCDINHCYAQIEEMRHPELREVPMAVGGHEEYRHGIILAKNDLAKKCNVKTAESLREALKKCPELCIIHPDYDVYTYYSEKVKDIYREYSDKVESFGIDEAWIDVTDSVKLFGDGYSIANMIQNRVYDELGLTVSIGISFNKIFAKFGSDLVKPSGLVEITHDNFKEVVWPCPVEDLLYVGRATKQKLNAFGITTIGELADFDLGVIRDYLGKIGELIYDFANGWDISEVALNGSREPVKSVGNGVTTPKDIRSLYECRMVFEIICNAVASRLRDEGLKGKIICVYLRNTDLQYISRQIKIASATNLAVEILDHAMKLVKDNYYFEKPLRSVSLSVSGLESDSAYQQLNLFIDENERHRQRVIEETVDKIRDKYGYYKIRSCASLQDEELTDFDPKGGHTIHPIGFLKHAL